MAVKVQVNLQSLYTHVYQLAEAVAAGAKDAFGTEVTLAQVAETLPHEILEEMGAVEAKKSFAHVPVADPHALADADAIIFGTPTRYGAATAQMQAFLDATGGLWAEGALIGKVGSAFTSTASQHGGQEATLIRMHSFFYHQGMVVAGVPYAAQELLYLDELSGGTPYGASTVAGPRGERTPTANEMAIARFQGRHSPNPPRGSRPASPARADRRGERPLLVGDGAEGMEKRCSIPTAMLTNPRGDP